MKRDEIRNNNIWARLTVLMLWLQMVYSLLAIFVYYSLYSLVSSKSVGLGYEKSHQFVESALLEMELPLSVLTILFFLIWFWRVYANFHILHPEKATYKKNWAIIGWFLPISSFYRPFVIMREIWLENQEDDEEAITEKRYRWVGWWWAFYLMQFIFPLISVVLHAKIAENVATLQVAYFTFICKYFFIILAAAFAIMLVFKINQSEQKLRKRGIDLDIYDHLVGK